MEHREFEDEVLQSLLHVPNATTYGAVKQNKRANFTTQTTCIVCTQTHHTHVCLQSAPGNLQQSTSCYDSYYCSRILWMLYRTRAYHGTSLHFLVEFIKGLTCGVKDLGT